MTTFRVAGLALAFVIAGACSEPVEPTPTVLSMTPDAVAMSDATYVMITGSGLALTFVSSVDDGVTVVDFNYILVLRPADGTETVSLGLEYVSSETIGTQIPAGLAAGNYSAWIQGPKGAGPVLTDALIVSSLRSDELCDPEQCSGAGGICEDGTCVIECDAQCAGVVCPEGVACAVTCRGQGCDALVDCSASSSCTIHCSGNGTCAGDILCGLGPCEIECSGKDSCAGTFDCAASCACDITCRDESDCMPVSATCPLGDTCESEIGCTSDGASCNTCEG